MTINKTSDSLFYTKNTGRDFGMRLTLDLRVADEFAGQQAQSVGALIAVHDPAKMISPYFDSIAAPVGFETSIGVRLQTVSRLPAPFK